jgi:FtsP/CotA-like multicopper oxidase with cupredoxin domain
MACAAALACAPLRPALAQTHSYRLVAAPRRVNIAGAGYPDTDAWAFDGTVPGPVLRVRQGNVLRVAFENRLPEESTIHWHGIRLPNAMDGVPHLTQAPVPPGGSFSYEFVAPDAGTFWYHPHANSPGQLGRGLYGALVVEEDAPPFADRDATWVLSDFRLDRDARIVTDFGQMFDASHGGRIGNTVTVNGRVAESFPMRAGERVRLRLLNAANARIFRLRFEGHAPLVVALDGHPVEPHAVPDGVVLGPGMRADLMLDAVGRPGTRHRVLDDWYRDAAFRLLDLSYDATPLYRSAPQEPVLALPPNPLAEPGLARAERLKLVLGGGAMSPELQRAAPEERRRIAERMRGGGLWTLNGVAARGHVHQPLFNLARGRSYIVEVHNDTAWHHPLHLHGVAFRVLSEARRPWRDTVLVAPRERVEIAFVADNPGDWMIHCHILEHQDAGMMATMRIE